ncbi:MAG: hypothetical protein IT562_16520 [Alphaproteobacteria bacterium]|nr:hypothetical protein [Alphaproteobacteria bacterium]
MTQRNEGEGNKTAARNYNEKTRNFVESGKVEKNADKARAAVEGAEHDQLEQAEKAGKARSKGEDPAVLDKRRLS